MKERNRIVAAAAGNNTNESFYLRETKHKIQTYYTVKEIAAMMNVTQKHVRNMINRGEIAAKRFGGTIRIPYSEFVKNIKDYWSLCEYDAILSLTYTDFLLNITNLNNS